MVLQWCSTSFSKARNDLPFASCVACSCSVSNPAHCTHCGIRHNQRDSWLKPNTATKQCASYSLLQRPKGFKRLFNNIPHTVYHGTGTLRTNRQEEITFHMKRSGVWVGSFWRIRTNSQLLSRPHTAGGGWGNEKEISCWNSKRHLPSFSFPIRSSFQNLKSPGRQWAAEWV